MAARAVIGVGGDETNVAEENPGGAGADLSGIDPVSYTHLDVYKRQSQCDSDSLHFF